MIHKIFINAYDVWPQYYLLLQDNFHEIVCTQWTRNPISINYENNFMVTIVIVDIGLRDDII